MKKKNQERKSKGKNKKERGRKEQRVKITGKVNKHKCIRQGRVKEYTGKKRGKGL